MAEDRYDVAIVGASLAGCAAATLLGRAGKRVALLERHTDPRAYKHLCTTVIQSSAVPTIRRLGLDGPIEAAGGVRASLALWTRYGWARDTLPHEEGYDIRREKLDPMIRELAAGTPGVDLLLGHTVRQVLSEGGRVVGVEADRPEGGPRQIRAGLVVGADGRTSEVAKLAGVAARVVKQHNRAGYIAFFRNVEFPHPGHAHIWMLEPDVAYAFPHDDGLAILAMMFDKQRVPEFKADVQGNYIAFLQSVPGFVRFDPADQVGRVTGLVDHPNLWRRRPPPGLAFIGDAMISGDPLFGIGCGWALQEAEWLADEVAPALGDPAAVDKAIGRYRATLRAKLGAHFFLISDYSTGRGYNPIEKLSFSAAARDPKAAHRVSEFGARTVPATSLLTPAAVAHAVRVNAGAGKQARAQTKQNLTMLRDRARSFAFAGKQAPATR